MATLLQTRQPSVMPSRAFNEKKVTVVHSGARDAYQVAVALEESGVLDALVTDLFWPTERPWARWMLSALPSKVQSQLLARSHAGIPWSKIRLNAIHGASVMALDKSSLAPHWLRRGVMRRADAALGRAAGRRAMGKGTAILSYSYYAYDAFKHYQGPTILFQLHPHPASMRRILTEELKMHPQCAESLNQEWELSLEQSEFEHLASEPKIARHILAASSFTRSTLVEQGISQESIEVIPYGVDTNRFYPESNRLDRESGKLRLLFVGRINQRKGIQYLLNAVAMVNGKTIQPKVELTVCGRVVDDLSIFRPFGNSVIIRRDVSQAELLAAYQAADLFVFPSVAEGFGQVLLEALATGLPILSTTRTAAPDLIESGKEGYVVDACSVEQLADRIEWALTHRRELIAMRSEARLTAEHFTWERFRDAISRSVFRYLSEDAEQREPDGRDAYVV